MECLFSKQCLYCECDSFSDCIAVYNLDIFMLSVSSFAFLYLFFFLFVMKGVRVCALDSENNGAKLGSYLFYRENIDD